MSMANIGYCFFPHVFNQFQYLDLQGLKISIRSLFRTQVMRNMTKQYDSFTSSRGHHHRVP